MTWITSPRARRRVVQGGLGLALFGLLVTIPLIDRGDALAQDHAATSSSNQSGATPLEPGPSDEQLAVYHRTQALREAVALSNEDLAAMDLTPSQAEAVLTRLVQWYSENRQQADAAEQAIRQARSALHDLQREIRTGRAPAGAESDVRDKHATVSRAEDALRALRLQAGTYALQGPAPEKLAHWQRVSALPGGLPVEMRHLDGMTRARLETLISDAARQGIGLDEALFVSEQQEAEVIRQRMGSKLGVVSDAEAKAWSGG